VGDFPDWFYIWAPKGVVALFLFAFGACVGSFLNVVIYRLPEGLSIVRPASRCPKCAHELRWFENLPIVSWLALRGRCRSCRAPISPQYVLIEMLVAVVFAGVYIIFFLAPPDQWWAGIGGEWWRYVGLSGGWPALIVVLTVLCGLLVATIIDARTFLIPAPITTAMTVIALVAWLVQGLLPQPPLAEGLWPIPTVGWGLIGATLGGWLGVGVAWVGLNFGPIPRSFADYEEFVPEGETLAEYPFARREMWKELLFLLPICIGLVGGGMILGAGRIDADVPRWLMAISAGLFGWLVGGGIVWGVRWLGTLAFGKEAMGMGDVHLLAAVGACLGWVDPIRIFFLAPFTALAWIALSRLAAMVRRTPGHELPYGPHLAAATVVIIFLRPAVEAFQHALFTPPVH
jgi:leader peptidase (prepilin peptidase)/N-methyltransferase